MSETISQIPQEAERCKARGSRWAALLLVLAVAAAYANSFDGVMLLDDRYIEKTPALGEPGLWTEIRRSSRPLVDLSFAINKAIGGLEPFGYHVFNLLVHLAATLALFGVVRRSLVAPEVSGEGIPAEGGCERGFSHQQTAIAFAIAVLWAMHPLQTQSVTYISQRAESMMGLFYLLTLYGVARAAGGQAAHAWSIAAVVACAMGMLSKPVMVTAPVMAVLYDRAFWAESWRQVFRRRWRLHVGLAATWMVLVLTGVVRGLASTNGGEVGFGVATATPLQYLFTQFEVIRHYLRLAMWPSGLCLDHQWPVAQTFAEVAGASMFVMALVVLTVIACIRRPADGFVGVLFFGVLLPTSSFVPIKDVIFEHRMYLSLASVAAVAVLGGGWLVRRIVGDAARSRQIGAAIVIVVALALGVRTHLRNRDYASAGRMWAGIVARYPQSARALNNLGAAYLDDGKLEEAERHYRRAVAAAPTMYEARYNLGHVLMLLGRGDEAIEHLSIAATNAEVYPNAMLDLGTIFASKGRLDSAISCFHEAIRAQPENADAHFNMGLALKARGDLAAARREFEAVLRIRPGDEEARRQIANSE
ncbi:MAG TPA: tetratricopeptide repeat protein [Phycisphaerae bacterium]|nr:tetratricopeptide repeat protein [Phycisphaerae bacterium]